MNQMHEIDKRMTSLLWDANADGWNMAYDSIIGQLQKQICKENNCSTAYCLTVVELIEIVKGHRSEIQA